MNKHEKGIYINSEFVKKIEEYDLNKFDNDIEFLECFIQFVIGSNSDYLYNKTYFRSFYKNYNAFVRNLRKSMLFIRKFIISLCSFLEDTESAEISFDEYIFCEDMKQDSVFEIEKAKIGKTIPDTLLSNDLKTIYIDCKITNADTDDVKMYYCAEEVNIYNDKAILLDDDQIADVAKKLYCKAKGKKNDNI